MTEPPERGPERPTYDRTVVQKAMDRELRPFLQQIVRQRSLTSISSFEEIEEVLSLIEIDMRAAVKQAFPEYTFEGVIADVNFSRRDPNLLSIQFCALTHSDKEEKLARGRVKIPSLVYAAMSFIDRSKIKRTSLEEVADSLQTDIDRFVGEHRKIGTHELAAEILQHQIAGQVFEGPIQGVVMSGSGATINLDDGTLASFSVTLQSRRSPNATGSYGDRRYRIIFSVRVESAQK